MSYEVYIEHSVEKELKQIPRNELKKIALHIREIASNPRPQGAIKLKGTMSDWRYRVGDYRIIYEIDDENKIIRIMRVRHRKSAYK